MRIYKCDICGKTIPQSDMDAHRGGINRFEGFFGTLIVGMDVCGECMDVGRDVDYRAAAVEAWKNAVDVKRESA